MSDKTEKPLFTGPALSLLRAVGVGADFIGSAGVIKQCAECISAATAMWPTDAFVAWKSVVDEMVRTLTAAKSETTQTAYRLFLTPDILAEQQRQFLAYEAPRTGDRRGNEAHALIGRALVVTASAKQLLPVDFFNGIRTLQLARNGKGRRSSDWDQFLKVDLTNSQEVLSISQCLAVKSPAAGFAKFSAAVLNALVIAPIFSGDSMSLASAGNLQSLAGEYEELPARPTGLKTLQVSISHGEQEILPDITDRFASADYTSFSEKLGLPNRDHLLVADLDLVTRKFQALMKDGTPEERGFVVLATLSLVTGWNGKIALKLGFSPGHNNWLDLEKGAWVWDFYAYRKSKGGSSIIETSEPIYCPWPSFLDQPLKDALRAAPDAKTVKDLIQIIQKTDQLDLKKYRNFLQSCGHPAHPTYAARFARSLQAVYLELTGSDMTTAMMTGFSASVAPAALFYYGPAYSTLVDRVAAIYARIGLGLPSDLFTLTGRAGCQKLLSTDDLQAGWMKLIKEINASRRMVEGAANDDQKRRHCNRWMALIGTGFIIQTAHRATRLECLTVGALNIHPNIVLINDKDESGRAQPRLVPKSRAIQQLLLGAAECRQKMESEIASKAQSHFTLNQDTVVFVQWSVNGAIDTESCLSTTTVSEITHEFFGSTANFGRSQWVTYLDQAGCDRWLIRSLTGHTRDVTRVHGPYLDIPPLKMAERLCEQMEKVGLEIFGQTAINTPARCQPKIALPKFKPVITKSVTDGPVPDPNTILAPLSVFTIAEWSAVERIRKDLYAGRIEAPVFALAFLHLVFIDQIPVSQACLDAVSGSKGSVKVYGQRKGVQWNRPHFVHPTWFPIQASTSLLLGLLSDPPPSSVEIIREVCRTVRKGEYGTWPSNDTGCLESIVNLTVSYRRLSFPPSLCAVSDLAVPAPCLSPQSLHRLSGEQIQALAPQSALRIASLKSNKKLDDWRFLVSTLNKYSSKLLRLGERQARAVNCLADLRNSTIFWTPFSAWIRDWSIEELQRSREGLDGCYQISTISTYLSALGSANDTIDTDDEPLDWEDAEWSSWVMEINRKSTPFADKLGDAEGKGLNERAKHALHALATSLIRRRQFVPLKIRSLLALQAKKTVCRNSASSTLILKADLAQSIEILKEWHKESPADFLLADFRATVSAMVPCRTGDISSLKTTCLTPGNGLVFERAGYDVHKTRSAIRLIPLLPSDASEFKQKMQVLDEHFGDRPLLLRGDGSHGAGIRDQRLANDFGLALKVSTGDEKARPHSVRAATLQEAAWPGWQEQAYELLQSRTDSQSCIVWINRLAEFPLRLSRAAAIAGQSDLRSALGNYLAAWPIIYAIYCRAALVDLSIEPAFLNQSGLSPANLRKARSRQLAQARCLSIQPTPFDTQAWIEQQATKHNMPRISAVNSCRAKPIQKQLSPAASSSGPQISEIEHLTYISVRALGLSQPRALERVVIPHSVATQLDMYLPSEELIAAAKRRLRKGPESRGQAADIEMALSSIGREALIWLCELDHDVFQAFQSMAFRTESVNRLMLRKVELFKKLELSIPKCLSIGIRFGIKHLDVKEKCALGLMSPAVTLSIDPRFGQRPEIFIALREKQNFVISARLTSVVRIYALALEEFRKHSKEAEHAV